MVRKIAGYLLTGTAFLACPCHLALTLPLVLTLVGGTSLGAFLVAQQEVVFLAATIYFLVGLTLGLVLLYWRRWAQPTHGSDGGTVEPFPVQHPVQSEAPVSEPSSRTR